MKSWLSETMTQYLGDSDADMIAFIVTQIRKRGTPQVSELFEFSFRLCCTAPLWLARLLRRCQRTFP
jgi:hypothetical protein